MVTSLRIIGVAALVLPLSMTTLSAQDMSGTWVLAVELDAGGGDARFELSLDGNTLTGTYSGECIGGGMGAAGLFELG